MPTSTCSGSTQPSAGAVRLDVLITCSEGSFANRVGGVAAGVGDGGYVAYSVFHDRPGRLLTISSTGAVTTEQGPTYAYDVGVMSDATGSPYLLGDRTIDVGLALYYMDSDSWWREDIMPPPPIDRAGHITVDGYFAPSGEAFVAYHSYDDKVRLARRGPAGGWTLTDVAAATPSTALAIDTAGRPHVPFVVRDQASGTSLLSDWRPGAPAAPYVLVAPIGPIDAVASGESAVVTLLSQQGLRVVAPVSGTIVNRTIAGTQALVVSGCAPPPGAVMPPTPCTETGTGVTAQAVTGTPEALWLAYVLQHIDRDAVQSCSPIEPGAPVSTCSKQTTTERSTAEVVLARVPRDGTWPPSIAWRGPIAGTSFGAVSMDARGSTLFLATWSSATSAPALIQYRTLDATKL